MRCHPRRGNATLLAEAGISQRMPGGGQVEARGFQSRLEAARYLHEALAEVASGAIENEVGLWGWLSLFYFDQVCPPVPAGRRRPKRDYRHILEPGYPFGHRHPLETTKNHRSGSTPVQECLFSPSRKRPIHVEFTFEIILL